MGWFSSTTKKDGVISFHGTVVSSTLPSVPDKISAKVTFENNSISLLIGNQEFTIKRSQVQSAAVYGERERVAQNRNSIGRSLVGGAIAGTTGAIIGGISGSSAKQVEKQHFYTYLSFITAGGEHCRIDFEVFPPLSDVNRFNQEVSSSEVVTTAL